MYWDKKKLRKILLLFSSVALGLIVTTSSILITSTLETRNNAVSLEKVEVAYLRLMRKYGEINFLNEKPILEVLQRELNTYIDSNFFNQGLTRQQYYQAKILEIFEANNISEDYIYIAFVASLFNPLSGDDKGLTRGMWRLTPETARNFGLRVNETVDERTDAEKSTLAAARYLKLLQDNYGPEAFTVVLAAYHAGEGVITQGIQQLNSSETNVNFWKLYKNNLIPSRTKAFVIRIITFLILAEDLLPADSDPADTVRN